MRKIIFFNAVCMQITYFYNKKHFYSFNVQYIFLYFPVRHRKIILSCHICQFYFKILEYWKYYENKHATELNPPPISPNFLCIFCRIGRNHREACQKNEFLIIHLFQCTKISYCDILIRRTTKFHYTGLHCIMKVMYFEINRNVLKI